MGNLTLAVGGLWGTIIGWFQSGVASFGLTIILFTVALKLVLSPLEIYQKVSSKKTMEKQAVLQPKLEKLQKQYGHNKELLNQKTMELYKKENFNMTGSCLGMLINLVITIVVFFTLFSSLNQISQYNIKTEYTQLTENYKTVLATKLKEEAESKSITISVDADLNTILTAINDSTLTEEEKTELITSSKAFAKRETANYYGEIKEGFLWIKNIYRPDTYASTFPNSNEYLAISGTNFNSVSDENPYIDDIYGVSYTDKEQAKQAFANNFDEVAGDINIVYSGWNGWLILVVLAAGVTILSLFISNLGTKPNNFIMMALLPILMVIFTLQYSAAFALYIVVNSLMSVLIGLVTTVVMNKIEKSKEKKKEGV